MPAIVAQEKLAAGETIRHNALRVLEAVTRRGAPEAGRPDEAPGLQRHQAVKNGNIHATWHHFCNSPNQSVAIQHNGFVQGRDRACDGATTAVIGPNAAGKATRFKRIAGLISGSCAVQLSDATRGDRAIYYMLQDTGSNAVLTASRRSCSWTSPTPLDLHRKIDVLGFVAGLTARTFMIVLIALHYLNHALRYCTNTIVMANGEMASSGATADFIAPAMLRNIYRVDARIESCSRGRLWLSSMVL